MSGSLPKGVAPKVVTYDAKHLPAFVSLNREWIERHFALEPMDLHQLENPQENILAGGGEIFFVIEGEGEEERVLGACAMVPHGRDEFELAKMAVSPDARGKGYGDLLMQTAIQWARLRRADSILILSNTVLEPAISLYRKHGARVVRLGPHPDYQRCNIEMRIELKA